MFVRLFKNVPIQYGDVPSKNKADKSQRLRQLSYPSKIAVFDIKSIVNYKMQGYEQKEI